MCTLSPRYRFLSHRTTHQWAKWSRDLKVRLDTPRRIFVHHSCTSPPAPGLGRRPGYVSLRCCERPVCWFGSAWRGVGYASPQGSNPSSMWQTLVYRPIRTNMYRASSGSPSDRLLISSSTGRRSRRSNDNAFRHALPTRTAPPCSPPADTSTAAARSASARHGALIIPGTRAACPSYARPWPPRGTSTNQPYSTLA